MSVSLRVTGRAAATRVEGPHLRYALWVAGCSIQCPGCCNPEMFSAQAGDTVAVSTLVAEIGTGVEGITVLGGEPLQQLSGVTSLAARAAARGLGVLLSTGYTEAQARQLPGFCQLWASVDSVVFGPFIATRREPAWGRSTIGSSNQRLLHRTARYRDAALWQQARGAEVHVGAAGALTVLGDPTLVARVRRRLQA